MSRPHPALMDIALERTPRDVDDFSELLRSAREHRMTGMLWSQIKSGQIEAPREWSGNLARIHLAVRNHHNRLWDGLADVGRKLDEAGIGFATFKGVTSEARWYDSEGERPADDLDIWLAPEDLHRFGEAVRLLQPDHPLADDVQELVGRRFLSGANIELESGIWVDLHADLLKLGIASRSAEPMWRRTEAFPLPGGGVTRVLDAETSLIHSLYHLNADRFAQLGRMTDVVRLLRRTDLDWEAIGRLVTKEGIQVPVFNSLLAVGDRLGIELPIGRPSGFRSWLWGRLWPHHSQLLGSAGARSRLRQRWMPFLARGRLGEVLVASGRSIFPPKEQLGYFFPESKGPYLWRVVAGRFRYQSDWRKRWAGDDFPDS